MYKSVDISPIQNNFNRTELNKHINKNVNEQI